MIKMGGLAENLARASVGASPALKLKLLAGKGMLRGAGKVLNLADEAAGAVARAGTAPGGSLARAAIAPAEKAVGLLKKSPRAMTAAAVGLPAYFYLRDRAANNKIAPLFNRSIEEGREVFANDKNFLEKKASAGAGRVKMGGMWSAVGEAMPGVASGIARGAAAKGGAGGAIAGGLSNILRGGVRTPMGAGMLGAGLGAGAVGLAGMLAKGIGKPTTDTTGYQLNRAMNPLTDRVKADELAATSFFSTVGSEVAKSLTGLLKDMAAKAVSAMTPGAGGEALVNNLAQSDDILHKADPQDIMNAYHTMAKFAPTLATDENAVRSFLREAIMAGNGPDYASIANLARAEKDIKDAKGMMLPRKF